MDPNTLPGLAAAALGALLAIERAPRSCAFAFEPLRADCIGTPVS